MTRHLRFPYQRSWEGTSPSLFLGSPLIARRLSKISWIAGLKGFLGWMGTLGEAVLDFWGRYLSRIVLAFALRSSWAEDADWMGRVRCEEIRSLTGSDEDGWFGLLIEFWDVLGGRREWQLWLKTEAWSLQNEARHAVQSKGRKSSEWQSILAQCWPLLKAELRRLGSGSSVWASLTDDEIWSSWGRWWEDMIDGQADGWEWVQGGTWVRSCQLDSSHQYSAVDVKRKYSHMTRPGQRSDTLYDCGRDPQLTVWSLSPNWREV